MDKKVLRKELIAIRKEIPDKRDKSMIIMQKIMDLEIFQKAKVVALYKSLLYEVDTDYLINYAEEKGKVILLPRIVNNELVFLIYQKDDILEENAFHILEPAYNENNIYHGLIDIIIVPGVGFDMNNNRLGYGGGYYDRFLQNNGAYKIGICFHEQLVNSLPIEKYDVKVDMVIYD